MSFEIEMKQRQEEHARNEASLIKEVNAYKTESK